MSEEDTDMVDIEMLKEMVMYISEKCKNIDTYAYTHLNKILHYSDIFWFAIHDESLSGEVYVKDKYGARATNVKIAELKLVSDGYLQVQPKLFHNQWQSKPVVCKQYNYKLLTEEQKHHIDKFIRKLANRTASEVKKFNHEDFGWKTLKKNEVIPYESVFFLKPKKPISKKTMNWAKGVVREFESETNA